MIKKYSWRWYVGLLILPLSTGAGLVVYILSHISLRLTVGLSVALGIAAAWIVWKQTPATEKTELRRKVFIGSIAGFIAMVGYDAARYLFVEVFHVSFWPFNVFVLFGKLLAGPKASPFLSNVVGFLFHFSNGIGFGVAYMLIFKKPNILTGLLWAAILEVFMIALYPGWLGIRATDELLSVSIVGHIVFGVILGRLAQWRLLQ